MTIEINGKEYSQNYLNELQISLEDRFDNRHIRKHIKQWIQEDLDKLEWTKDLEPKQIKTCLDILAILLLQVKRVSINALIEMLVSRNINDIDTSVDSIMEHILLLINMDLVNVEQDNKGRLYVISEKVLTEEQADLLDSLQYKLPMIVQPLQTNQKQNNRGSGYYLKASDSLILNNEHQYDIDSTVLDRLNSIPFTINETLMKNIRNSWKCMVQDNSLESTEETSLHPDTLSNFNRFEKDVFKTSAIMINHGNRFYFTHKYDKRGRVYCCGYHLNYQGNSYAKAQLELANKQLITEEINFF